MMAKARSRWFIVAARSAITVITLSNLIILSSQAASTHYMAKATSSGLQVAADLRSPTFNIFACMNFKCQAIDDFNTDLEYTNEGLSVESVASICEGISLVTIISSFVVAGVCCIRRFREASAHHGATSTGNKSVQRQIIVTVSTVFVTFLLRSLYAIVLGVSRYDDRLESFFNADIVQRCISICLPCQSLGNIVQAWSRLTPEFSGLILLLSSPLTMLVALWGMSPRSSHLDRQQLLLQKTERTPGLSMRSVNRSSSPFVASS